MLLLQDNHWQAKCDRADRIEGISATGPLWEETREALDRLMGTACDFYEHYQGNDTVTECISCFFIHAIYLGTLMTIRLSRGNPDTKTAKNIHTSKQLLRHIDRRWKLGGMVSFSLYIIYV